MAKKIKYYVDYEMIRDSFSPAKKHIPKWYKNILPEKQVAGELYKTNVKNCIPFLDAFLCGYMIETTQDFIVSKINDEPIFNWRLDTEQILTIGRREENYVPAPEGFYQIPFVWKSVHSVKLPPGYSAIFTHPLNRTDLPFYSLSGIVDMDEGMNGGSYPFFIEKSFEGIIPSGTPILQVIPFKRESWKSEFDEDLKPLQEKHRFLSSQVMVGWYKNKLWKKKSFE